MGDLQARREAYARVSSAMASLDDAEMREAVLRDGTTTPGEWGVISHRAEIAGVGVFVKRIPLTEAEHSNLFSTRNRFRLPAYYSYGVGSAGFGVFRELASHVKTTEWVLEGAIESFPLLHQARVMARPHPSVDPGFDLDDYVGRWNGSKAVAGYMKARADARHEVWLVLERFPHTLATWLPANQGAAGRVIDELRRTIAFLRSQGIVHFDAHLRNVVGDGERWYLTDFGLALDARFDLSDRERGCSWRSTATTTTGRRSQVSDPWCSGCSEPWNRRNATGWRTSTHSRRTPLRTAWCRPSSNASTPFWRMVTYRSTPSSSRS